MKDWALRKSCYHCKFKKLEDRSSDITIADFWGIGKIDKSLNSNKGVSLVIAHNDKGLAYVEGFKDKVEVLEEVDLVKAIEPQGNTRTSKPLDYDRRMTFFQMLQKGMKFSKAYKDTTISKKVALIDKFDNINRGGALTVLAAYEIIKQLGYEPTMLRFPVENPYDNPNATLRIVNNFYKYSKESVPRDKCKLYNKEFQNFVVASDVVFSQRGSFEKYNIDWNYYLFLPWVRSNRNKIAWASSFGTSVDENWTGEKLEYVVSLLKRFNYLSIREEGDAKRLNELGVNKAQHISDPVMGLPVQWYREVSNFNDHSTVKKKYLLMYYFSVNDKQVQIAKHICNKFELTAYVFNGAKHKKVLSKYFKKGDVQYVSGDFSDWLWYFDNASYVQTHSFHGICFSLIFNIPFLATSRGGNKVPAICDHYGLSDRYYTGSISSALDNLLDTKLDWNKINIIIEKDRKSTVDYINSALTVYHSNI